MAERCWRCDAPAEINDGDDGLGPPVCCHCFIDSEPVFENGPLNGLVCTVCGKGPVTGNHVSHANNRVKRRWYPNLQTVRTLVDGAPRRVQVCTRCIKSNKVAKAT